VQILIVEDDRGISSFLEKGLRAEGYVPVVATTAGEALVAFDASDPPPALVLLALGLPSGDGEEVLRQLRRDGHATPVIVLTARAEVADKVSVLNAGANDYVTKPFRFAVLLARIRAHLRSHEQSEDAVFHLGPYEFRPAGKLLLDQKGKKIRLTEKETSILKYLYRQGEKAVPREELLSEVWGYNAGVTTHTLETHIYRLRQKIEPEPASAKLLLTEAGGYRLKA